jgi:AraC-like DNA-binding protein
VFLRETPDFTIIGAMDALSDVLRVLRLTGAVFLDADFTASWCVVSEKGRPIPGLSSADHIAFFHLLTKGQCKARLATGGETIDLAEGDLLLLPNDATHLMGSDLTLMPVPSTGLVEPGGPGEMVRIRHGGGGESTRFVCGFLACDRRLCKPVFDALPGILRIPIGSGPTSVWLTSLLRLGAQESSSPRAGSDTVLAKLAELLFVEAIRRHIETMPAEQTGWLAGLRDRFVGKALGLLHERPEHPWTVDELGAKVGLARTTLTQRFTDLVGQPPIQYLTRWRLTVAAQRLRTDPASLSRIAGDIGYESQAAFNRAFKREFGIPPAAWRKSGLSGRAIPDS